TMQFSRNTTVIIITASTKSDWIAATRNLANRGVKPTAVLIDPASFNEDINTVETEIELTASHIPHYIIRQGDPLEDALANARSTNRR
ncbi:MAG: hypothetical protein KDJ65_40205, partial [Anaerolineae bacterium]|nr:hypothetical protein [Anaerolineae bacterium]